MKKCYLLGLAAALLGGSYAWAATAVPCTFEINSEAAFAEWQTVDANADGGNYQWKYNTSGYAIYKQNSGKPANDWLITPSFAVEAGSAYKVTVFVRNASSYTSDKQDFELRIGAAGEFTKDNVAADLPTVICTINKLAKSTDYQQFSGEFTAAAAGDMVAALYEKSASYMGDTWVQKIVVEKVVAHPGAVTSLVATPGAEGAMEAVLSWNWPTANDKGGTFEPITGANVFRGTTSSFTSNDASKIATITPDPAPEAGASATYTAAIDAPGTYYFRVVPFNDNGESAAAPLTSSAYVGVDTPGMVTDLAAALVEGNDNAVSLTFTPPTGKNGGYIDLSKVVYNIKRTDHNKNTVMVAEAWAGTLPYVDTTIPGLGAYTYEVIAYTAGTTAPTSGRSMSTPIVTRGTVALPYSTDFKTDVTKLWEITAVTGTSKWTYSSSGYMNFYTSKGNQFDTYAKTPLMHFEAGKMYEVTFTPFLSSSTSAAKTLAVCIDNGADAPRTIWEQSITTSTRNAKAQKFYVDATGDYRICFRTYGIAPDMNDIRFTDVKVEEIVITPGVVTEATVTPGEAGALSATISWTNPTVTNGGTPLAAIDRVVVKRGDVTVGTVEAPAPGAASSVTDAEVPSAGKHTYTITPYLGEHGTETVTVTSTWIGPDTPGSVSGVVASLVDDNDRAIAVTFTAPTGKNGGYVDPATMSYRIRRTDTDNVKTTLEEAWKGELPYVDTTIPGLGYYTYEVTSYVDGTTPASYGSSSNSLTTRGTAALPYSTSFASDRIKNLMQFTHTTGTRDWFYSSSGYLSFYSSSTTAEVAAYAKMPVMTFEAGKVYEVTLSAKIGGKAKPLALTVENVEDGTPTTIWAESISSTAYTAYSQKFSVPATGTYRLALYVEGKMPDSSNIYVNGFKVEETIITPAAVTEATATAAAEGALSATVAWTNPSTTNAGGELTSLDRVEVMRGEELIATVEAPAPGSVSEITDAAIAAPGVYTYTITPYMGTTAGESVTVATAWVGIDTPKAPANVAVAITPEGRTVSFDAVTEGINGGYIPAADVVYTIARDGAVIAEGIAATTYTDTEAGLPYNVYAYTVAASLPEAEAGQPSAAVEVKFGTALELPYTPDLTSSPEAALWTMTNSIEGKGSWKPNTAKGALVNDTYSGVAWAFTPPFHGARGTMSVSFRATCYRAAYPETVEVYLCNAADSTATVPTAEDKIFLGQVETTSAAYAPVTTFEANIADPGTYYVAFVNSAQMTCTLTEPSLLQTYLDPNQTTGIASAATGTTLLAYNREAAILSATANGTITVTATDGTVVATTEAATLSTAQLGEGLYIATLTTADGTAATIKFVK